jgi:hypothetical protein
MSGVTHKIEKAIEALEKGQLKQALYLTDKDKLSEHHKWIEEAARTCLANRDNKKVCADAIKEAQEKLRATITAPLEDTSLEGVEEMLSESKPAEPEKQMSEEELYESCEECHIANAVAAATEVCDQHPQNVCTLVTSKLDKEDTQPEEWIKVLKQTANQAEGPAKAEMAIILGELTDYLKRRNSPFLKALKEE